MSAGSCDPFSALDGDFEDIKDLHRDALYASKRVLKDEYLKRQQLEEWARHQHAWRQTLSRLRFEALLGREKIPFSLRGTKTTLKRTHYLKRGKTKGNSRPSSQAIPFMVGKLTNKGADAGGEWPRYDSELDGVVVTYRGTHITLQRKGDVVEVTKVEKATRR
jgi:hypothetical protein